MLLNMRKCTGEAYWMKWIPLPIGVDSFEKIIRNHYYYIDKTLYIKELLDRKGEVNLFTRPRRFGKTLNMSMLRYFFEKRDYDNAELGRVPFPHRTVPGHQYLFKVHEAVFL